MSFFYILYTFIQKDSTKDQAIDCEVGDWSVWSECKRGKICNQGIQERQRSIKRNPDNGGKDCPKLKERRKCFLGAYGCDENNLKNKIRYFF